MLNNHYKDILLILSEKKVKFMLVGAYAMAVHGYPRSTMDIDLFVMPDPENAHFLSIPDLITNKMASGRKKDLADIEILEGINELTKKSKERNRMRRQAERSGLS